MSWRQACRTGTLAGRPPRSPGAGPRPKVSGCLWAYVVSVSAAKSESAAVPTFPGPGQKKHVESRRSVASRRALEKHHFGSV